MLHSPYFFALSPSKTREEALKEMAGENEKKISSDDLKEILRKKIRKERKKKKE